MKFRSLPSKFYLRECLNYDPDTGVLLWRVRPVKHFANKQAWSRWNNRYTGKEFGRKHPNGSRGGHIDWQWFYSHRVVWKWMTGRNPNFIPDHINRDGLDNRWTNLRRATHSQNCSNHSLRPDNKSGHAGVFFSQGEKRWKVQINTKGRRISVGTFVLKSEALAARQSAEKKYHKRFVPDVQEMRT